MPDDPNTTTAPAAEAGAAQQDPPATGDPKDDDGKPLGEAGERALAQEREARKAAERDAKALRKEVDEIRRSSMSEAEKAVAEAEARGKAAATTEFGQRLARAEIRAAAKGKNLDGVFDYLDLSRFVGDDGEPDTQAIEKFVGALPDVKETPPSFDGGTRTSPPAPVGMTELIRRRTGRG